MEEALRVCWVDLDGEAVARDGRGFGKDFPTCWGEDGAGLYGEISEIGRPGETELYGIFGGDLEARNCGKSQIVYRQDVTRVEWVGDAGPANPEFLVGQPDDAGNGSSEELPVGGVVSVQGGKNAVTVVNALHV